MASQSPSIQELPESDLQQLADPARYLEGWAALASLMDQDHSWSGHERNCVFVNQGGGAFADVSALSGLDFADDGRACVATDLDGDGDLDLVSKNRSGPQLRFLRNGLGVGESLMVRLRDELSGNRDAIGARVELVAGERRLVRTVTAGDGYLGQASRWLHFGLDRVPAAERLLVRWPDGREERFAVPEAARRVLAVRGSGALEILAPARRAPTAGPGPLLPLPPPAAEAVVLREPLLLPPTLAGVAFRGQPRRPVLLALWSRSHEQCTAGIAALAAGNAELQRGGVDLVFLGLHESADQARAALGFRDLLAPHPGAGALMRQRPASAAVQHAFAALLEATLGRDTASPPVALLVDAQARVQVVYFGAVTVEDLIADNQRFGLANIAGPLRSHRAGRWAFAVERSLAPLVDALARRGLKRDAAFFAGLAGQRRK